MKTQTQTMTLIGLQKYITGFACMASLLLALAGCGGGGSGGGGNAEQNKGEESRRPESVIFLSQDRQQLIAVADDASVTEKVLSATPFTDIQHFQLSPDGEYVAYIADATSSGQYDLYVSEVDGDGPLQVSQLGNAFSDVMDFAWSPDSSKLAYRADNEYDERYELFVVKVDGNDGYQASNLYGYILPVHVSEHFSWSPDGHYLAYVLDAPGHRYFSLYSHDASQGVQDLRTAYIHYVSSTSNKEIVAFKWSPDSQTIAFKSDDFSLDDQYEIYTIVADGSAAAQPANGEAGSYAQIDQFIWSPDSRYLAETVVGYPNAAIKIGINSFDLSTMASTADPNLSSSRVVTTSYFGDIQWAHNSNRLAFVAGYDVDTMNYSGELALIVYDVDNNILDDINNDPSVGEQLLTDNFIWSPNDAHIAYLTNVTGGNRLYIASADGSTDAAHAVTPDSQLITGLSWSGDSRGLGALSVNEGAAYHPGNWYIFDNQGQQFWKSADVYSYDSSRSMRWSVDNSRAVYSTGKNGVMGSDFLHSVTADNGESINVSATAASPSPVFEYSEESLLEESSNQA